MKDVIDKGERSRGGGKRLGATTGPAKRGWEINGDEIEGIKRDSEKGSTNWRGRVTRPAESREGIIIQGRERSRLRWSRQEVGKGVERSRLQGSRQEARKRIERSQVKCIEDADDGICRSVRGRVIRPPEIIHRVVRSRQILSR